MPTGTELKKAIEDLTRSSNPQQTGANSEVEQYDHIQLEEEEIAEALRLMRKEKHFAQMHREYLERVNKPRTYNAFTAPQLEDFFKRHYESDSDNELIVRQICRYFAGDSEFDGDLKKGLFVMGTVGVGKTALMEIFQQNQIYSYRVESCRKIEENISQHGEDYLRKCSVNIKISENSNYFGHREIGFCFDDLGTEDNSKHYGKERNVMAEIILNRYDSRLPFNSTHITTNLTSQEVLEKYGTRVVDRIKHMFNIIKFPVNAKSRRK